MIIKFLDLETHIEDDLIEKDVFDVDFNGVMMIQFKNVQGKYFAINGMDGWGRNVLNEVRNKEAYIITYD